MTTVDGKAREIREFVQAHSHRLIERLPQAGNWLLEYAALLSRAGDAAVDVHPKTRDLVERFSRALLEKLAAAEKKYGYSDGWASVDWMDECRVKLVEHVAKGDPRDVAAYCAFLWHHKESTKAPPPNAASGGMAFILRVLRNPYGWNEEQVRSTRLKAADWIEARLPTEKKK